ncbi:hypothetical protein HDU76_010182 [Blyttiomyces sp. JEL0837]|nr:hypothetical protein HDU76_010182 [Blyttiomyces sp. JEL0837]
MASQPPLPPVPKLPLNGNTSAQHSVAMAVKVTFVGEEIATGSSSGSGAGNGNGEVAVAAESGSVRDRSSHRGR